MVKPLEARGKQEKSGEQAVKKPRGSQEKQRFLYKKLHNKITQLYYTTFREVQTV